MNPDLNLGYLPLFITKNTPDCTNKCFTAYLLLVHDHEKTIEKYEKRNKNQTKATTEKQKKNYKKKKKKKKISYWEIPIETSLFIFSEKAPYIEIPIGL